MENETGQLLRLTGRYLSFQQDVYGPDFIFRETNLLKDKGAMRLGRYSQSIRDCSLCPLSETRTHIVFGAGNSHANLMLVGEAPGREEDLRGEPFVGAAGQLLDKILQAIGFTRDDVYIANILKCRPPKNRDPQAEEIASCITHLEKQIEIIQPHILLTLGRIAAQVLLDTTDPMKRLRESTHSTRGIHLIATYHPAALLRNPGWKKFVWQDVQAVRHLYDEIVGDMPPWQPPQK